MDDLSRAHLDVWHDTPRHPDRRSGVDERWLARAAKIAAMAEGRWRGGCVLVRGGSALSAAANIVRNDPSVCGATPFVGYAHKSKDLTG
jgi:hypothetical protein